MRRKITRPPINIMATSDPDLLAVWVESGPEGYGLISVRWDFLAANCCMSPGDFERLREEVYESLDRQIAKQKKRVGVR